MRYSAWALAWNALTGQKHWQPVWRDASPKAAYDGVIVGGGGHGLATAHYLAKEHGITNVAVLEKNWIGSGNAGRNTTIIRSNYLWEPSEAIYGHAHKLWHGLSQELNYNVMFSPRGVMLIAHSHHDEQVFKRHIYANRLAGTQNEWLTPEQAKEFCPPGAMRAAHRCSASTSSRIARSRRSSAIPPAR
jgi:sarcosine oxidase subunit beta